MDATTCPECGAPAEIVDRDTLDSTDGPLEIVKLYCVRRHWYLLPAVSVTVWPPAQAPAQAPAPAPARAPAPAPARRAVSAGTAGRRPPRPARRWR